MAIKLSSGQIISETDPNFEEYKNTAGSTIVENPTMPTAPTQTIADAYGSLNFETPEERAFREAQGAKSLSDANSIVDENAIRTKTLAEFQAEIDALNRVYAEKKRVESIAGQGRLGSVAAIGARRGLLGSDFGNAQTNNQETANTQAINAIEDERLLKQSAILSEARNLATKEIENKTEAKRLGAENYLKYISESSTRRENNAKEIAKRLYDQGIENPDYASIAKELGISVEALKSTYEKYELETDAAIAQKTNEENIKRQESLLKEGYNYIKTPAERDNLKAQGYDIIEIDGRTYGKKPKLTTKTQKMNGVNYMITLNEMGDIVKKIPIGGGNTPTPKNSAEKEMLEVMGSAVGPDGYISQDDYASLRNQWASAGLNVSNFDSKFKGYRNPNNPYYVTNKQD